MGGIEGDGVKGLALHQRQVTVQAGAGDAAPGTFKGGPVLLGALAQSLEPAGEDSGLIGNPAQQLGNGQVHGRAGQPGAEPNDLGLGVLLVAGAAAALLQTLAIAFPAPGLFQVDHGPGRKKQHVAKEASPRRQARPGGDMGDLMEVGAAVDPHPDCHAVHRGEDQVEVFQKAPPQGADVRLDASDFQGKDGRLCSGPGQFNGLGFAAGEAVHHRGPGEIAGFIETIVHDGDAAHPREGEILGQQIANGPGPHHQHLFVLELGQGVVEALGQLCGLLGGEVGLGAEGDRRGCLPAAGRAAGDGAGDSLPDQEIGVVHRLGQVEDTGVKMPLAVLKNCLYALVGRGNHQVQPLPRLAFDHIHVPI